MTRMSRRGGLLALILTGSLAQAQPPMPGTPINAPAQAPTPSAPVPATPPPAMPGTPVNGPVAVTELPQAPRYGLDQQSIPAELAEELSVPVTPRMGPTPVADVRFLMDNLGAARLLGDSGLRTFGWVEGGYTYSTGGSGVQSVQPRLNFIGNDFLFNQLGLVLQKPLKQDQFDWGFNIRYFAGADAATGQPKGGIDDPPGNARFGQDFRDLNLMFHLPILTDGGVNLKVGRMNTIIGWNGFLAPYRPLYSSDYQFFYSQDGAFTGALAEVVVSDRLDIWSGITMGANTFYTMRSDNSYCYIGQINYWLDSEQRTRLTTSVYTGPDAISAAPGLAGDRVTMLEFRILHHWNERFLQVVQSNMGWDQNTPVGTGSWYGVYTVGILHLNCTWDLIGRAEWFNDIRGTRTGFNTDYSEVTLGVNWHPNNCIEIRPEIRGDFAGERAFGGSNTPRDYSQLTLAISALIKF